jgi:phage shock protein PspC (stress-responsive transcriptional regulator)
MTGPFNHPIANRIKDTMTNRKFTLDKPNGKLLGVCSGLANYFGVDPLLMRIGFVVTTLMFGAPLLAYIIIALVAD